MRIYSLRPLLLGALSATFFASACSEKSKPEESELAAAASSQPATPPAKVLPTSLDDALKSEYRTKENQSRDEFRHPKETLEFFGLKPDMRVVEIAPGRGWYTEILAPYLAKDGAFIAALPPANGNEMYQKFADNYRAWFTANPDLKSEIVDFVPGQPMKVSAPVDMIVTFRSVHGWMGAGKAQDAFKTFFTALKPGGILGVEAHREDPKKKQDPKAKSGYVKESEVIRLAEKAGFKLDQKSEINANPKDTRNHPKGVWSLPPTLAEGDKDKDKYVAIGESDRMTLRFVKPEAGEAKKAK